MSKNNMVGMVLAGGRGSRLYALTNKVAKPAVYFGGKYRIIDFPISNCANSNIDVVGVLTQYESVLLNAYASAGHRWGLDSQDSGVFVLPPREKADADLNVYRGTADAITQNIDFLDQYDPEYVLILSGDHIYKMDYADMLAFHKENNADCTIAVMPVPMEEASRFGIMNTDKDKRIIEFEEKPAQPKSNLASMGIYIFNYKELRKVLLADEKEDTAHDFGKNIIPTYLNTNKNLFAYEFTGYWKDVGTVTSLWEANMDLIYNSEELDLNDPAWKIYTQNQPILPHFIGDEASVSSSYINQGASIEGTVEGSVLSHDVQVAKGAIVKDSVIMPGVKIGEGAVVTRCIVAEGVKIEAGAVVGSADSSEIELVSKNVKGEK